MADYPTQTMASKKSPTSTGHVGQVIDKNIEGRAPEAKTIRPGAKKN